LGNETAETEKLEQSKDFLNESGMNSLFKQRANLNRGAMETGDHFKNGARPKSQMNRGNVKKID
jgi:hypothetical protein